MKSSVKYTAFLVLVLVSSSAFAEKKNPLEGQPAIRNRYEVRDNRFEVGPSFAFSLNRNLRHSFLVGLRANYHINNYFSVGTDLAYGVGFNSGLHGELADSYALAPDTANTAEKDEKYFDNLLWQKLNNRLSDVKFAGDIRVAFTPIQGRIGAFSKLFINYDMYIFAGLGMGYTQNKGNMGDNDDDSDFRLTPGKSQVPSRTDPNQSVTFSPKEPYFQENFADVDAANEGFRVGPAFGVGMHMLINNFLSIGVEVRDLIFEDNETGSDYTRGLSDEEKADTEAGTCKDGSTGVTCRYVGKEDRSMVQHWYFGFNFTVFFPFEVGVTR